MNNNLTEVVFILDRSGSMWPLAADTVGGFNSMLEKQREGEGVCLVSTVLFNHYSTVLYDRVSIDKAKPMTEAEYAPSGSTALYDALGDAIHHIGLVHKYAREEDRPGRTLFIITTDGMENASRRYSREKLEKLIEGKKQLGWEFLFLASDLGALRQARGIGISEDRISVSSGSSEGVHEVFACCEEVVACVRSKKSIKKNWNENILKQMKTPLKEEECTIMDEEKNTMLGAIIGDIVGSVYEWHNIKTKDFPFFSKRGFPTDDSIMTLALADAILLWDEKGRPDYESLSQLAAEKMREYGRRYPHSGYGGRFRQWLANEEMGPYNSCGNGSAMRVSAVGYAARTLEECIALSKAVTEVTHNHPDGIMGAEATAVQIFLLRQGKTLEEVKAYEKEHYYPIDFTIPEIRPDYEWGSLCSNTCPMAFESVYEARNFEDAVRNAISIGGDSDTLAAIAGGIAASSFGIPKRIQRAALSYLDPELQSVVKRFDQRFLSGK